MNAPSKKRVSFPKYFSTMLRYEQSLYENAYYLTMDSCLLFKNESYPTSFSLAVLAYEEIGKVHMLDHIGFEARMSPRSDRYECLSLLFDRSNNKGGQVFNHAIKQQWATHISECYSDKETDRLNQMKQLGFYVDYSNGRIVSPRRISKARAYRQLLRVAKSFDKTSDLPFLGLFEESSLETKRVADEYIIPIRSMVDSLSLV